MAFVPSATMSNQEDGNGGLVKRTFVNGIRKNHLVSSIDESSSCTRTDSRIYFGQKAELSTNCDKGGVEAFSNKRAPWVAPSSVSAFSELNQGSGGLSSLRSIATASQSCDQDVETDLARVHPNSATTQYDRFHEYFLLPKSNDANHKTSSSLLSPCSDEDVPNGHSMFRQTGRSLNGNDRLSVKSSLTPAFGTVPKNRYNMVEKSTASTSTPSSIYPRATNSSQLPALSHIDLVDTEVKFTDLNKKKTYQGIVQSVSHTKIATILKPSGDKAEVHCSQLKLVSPSVNDKVKIVRSTMGNSKILGKMGTLLSITITGDSGVVQFHALGGDACRNLAEVKLSHLAKYVKAPRPSSDNLSTSSASSSSSIWGSVVLENGATFPFAPFPAQATSVSFPTILPISSNFPVFKPASLSSPMSAPSNDNGIISSAFAHPPALTSSGAPAKYPTTTAFPFSFKLPTTGASTNPFLGYQLVSRGGSGTGHRDNDSTKGRHSTSSHPSVAGIIDRLLSNQRRYHANKDDDSNVDVKASSVRVSLICPISQKRLKYPSRGNYCKHLQCFDAEAYILMNLNHKPKARVKQSNGRSFVQPLPTKKWYCPICLKHVQDSQLYIDRSLMKVLSDIEDSVMEVELSESGTWRPYKKDVIDVIDLTADDD